MTNPIKLTTFLSRDIESGWIYYLKVEFGEINVVIFKGSLDEIGEIVKVARKEERIRVYSLIKEYLKNGTLKECKNLNNGVCEITTVLI